MKANVVVRVVSLCSAASKPTPKANVAAVCRARDFPADGVRKPRLTSRELEVLGLLCEGLSNKLICRRLNICTGTVKCHVASILSTLGVSSRLQAVLAAYRLGLVTPAQAALDDDDDSAEEASALPPSRAAHLVAAHMSAAA